MQRLMVRGAFVHFAEILEILYGLNEATVVVQNLLNVRRAWWWRRCHSGRSTIIRWHDALLIWWHRRWMLLCRLLRLLLCRSVRHRHFSFLRFRRLLCLCAVLFFLFFFPSVCLSFVRLLCFLVAGESATKQIHTRTHARNHSLAHTLGRSVNRCRRHTIKFIHNHFTVAFCTRRAHTHTHKKQMRSHTRQSHKHKEFQLIFVSFSFQHEKCIFPFMRPIKNK